MGLELPLAANEDVLSLDSLTLLERFPCSGSQLLPRIPPYLSQNLVVGETKWTSGL